MNWTPCAVPQTLGITLKASSAGVTVDAVGADTPAALAGLRSGDILLRYSGVWVNDARHARALIRESVPGSTVEIEVLREGKVERVFVPL